MSNPLVSEPLKPCPFCGQTPDKIEHDNLGPFVWHQSAWCPIAAPVKMAPDVWQRRHGSEADTPAAPAGGAE